MLMLVVVSSTEVVDVFCNFKLNSVYFYSNLLNSSTVSPASFINSLSVPFATVE